MKKLIFTISVIIIFISACKNNDVNWSDAAITGADPRMCACCGGWFIKIDSMQYRFNELPANNGINLDSVKYPVDVRILWSKSSTPCIGDEITIQQIKLR